MPNDLLKMLSDPTPVLSLVQLLCALGLTFVLSLVFSRFYHKYNLSLSTSPSFAHTLVLISLTACFIMMVIGNSLARAFSLAGALSIVRFRNALKETEEIAAIFLAMSIGISNGAGYFMLTSVSTVTIMGFWLLLKTKELGITPPTYVIVELEPGSDVSVVDEIKGIDSPQILQATLLESVKSELANHTFFAYRFKIEGRNKDRLDRLVAALSQNARLGFKRLVPETPPS